ncbi:50S ribosomal protein L18 [Pullulanibacillus sp. KACC 23026]|uniref:50S ribosomal protein L18 n=1 Tax=Pullulanibacillus sp. KACC 23026 TaxID=3028315 RepID=UPI0023AFFFEC|nr:50S ribosomal protein L18 [Pullulanibacillus sp. KACC 23026]WEG12658.1 50S ribosomal protein L18 [Pullulanibacillus sp. KACC 23026]
MITKPNKNAVRKKRHQHVRTKVVGTAARPRLNVFRSSKHIYAQLINDESSSTIVSASSLKLEKGNDVEAAKKVGEAVAKLAVEKGVTKVVFDRGGYLYHGRIQALADAAREAGLEF